MGGAHAALSAWYRAGMTLLVPFVLAALPSLVSTTREDWPVWRGPRGDGTSSAQALPERWTSERNVKWRTPLARPANGSPIVAGTRIFLTTAQDEDGRQRSLLCFDRATGALQWERTVEVARKEPTHRTNPFAGSTPAADAERVYVWHGTGGLHAYTHTGEVVWSRDLGDFVHMWGYGTSPVVHDGLVLLHTGPDSVVDNGPEAQSFVAAFDAATGEQRWRTVEPNHLDAAAIEEKRLAGSWCTPIVVRVGERQLVLCTQPTRLVAYDFATGEIVWWCKGVSASRGDLAYSSPTMVGDVCVVVGGYVGPIFGVRIDGEGDVTESHRTFHLPEQLSNCASGIAVDGCLLVPDMGGILWCIDPREGKVVWKERVLRGETWGSFVRAGERLYLMGQKGATAVIAARASNLEVLATNDLGEDTNSTPAVAGDELFLRTHAALYCIANAASD